MMRQIRKFGSKNNDRKNLCSESAFTLIEVMVALVVLLVGMLGVIGMQYYSVTGNTASRELRIATNLSEEIIEQMKATSYAGLASGSDNPAADIARSGGLNFQRAWWVLGDCLSITLANDDASCNAALAANCDSDPDDASAVPVSAIRARACWNDKNGATHSVTLDSLRWDENVIP